MSLSIRCPHCDKRATIRTSRQLSPLLKECRFSCTDVMCGHTFVAYLEVKYTTSPPARPSPAVRLPLSEHVDRPRLAQSLQADLVATVTGPRGVITCKPSGCIHGVLLSRAQVVKRVSAFAEAYRYALTQGTFPEPFHRDEQHALWREMDVQDWMDQRNPHKRMAA